MAPIPKTRIAIMAYLTEYGSADHHEIAEALDMHPVAIQSAIWQARHTHGTEMIRIASWTRHLGHGGMPTPVYTVGPGKDAKRPVMGDVAKREWKARYEAKNRAIRNAKLRKTVPSPWHQLLRMAA